MSNNEPPKGAASDQLNNVMDATTRHLLTLGIFPHIRPRIPALRMARDRYINRPAWGFVTELT